MRLTNHCKCIGVRVTSPVGDIALQERNLRLNGVEKVMVNGSGCTVLRNLQYSCVLCAPAGDQLALTFNT